MDFKARLELITKRNKKVVHTKNHSWPVEKKLETVGQYLVLGNLRQVSAVVGVAYDQVRRWKTQPWWAEMEKELRATQNIKMDEKLTTIVEKSLDATLDRVENGDFFYDQKAGEVKRKPVALRDVHRVAIDTLGKRELLRGNATERREVSQVSVSEQLKQLAMEFAKWSNKQSDNTIELMEVEDAVYVEKEDSDALYEERETGLQAGAELGEDEETGEGEGESSSQRSESHDGESRESP